MGGSLSVLTEGRGPKHYYNCPSCSRRVFVYDNHYSYYGTNCLKCRGFTR